MLNKTGTSDNFDSIQIGVNEQDHDSVIYAFKNVSIAHELVQTL